VICQGGYNTIAELTTLGVPAICLPAERKFDDQHERAMKTAETYSHFTFGVILIMSLWLLLFSSSENASYHVGTEL